MKYIFIISIIFIITYCISCSKYDEGPDISLRSKKDRIVNTWKLDKGYLNNEEVILFANNNSIEFKKGGDYILKIDTSSTSDTTYYGTWQFNNTKEYVIIDFSGIKDTLRISKLKKDELWIYEYISIGKLDMHYVPL